MIDDELLEILVTFEQCGTLSATAEKLMVTQPTITRNMQKLEDLLGVKLFDRKPNRLSLTETGKFAVQEASKVLAEKKRAIHRIQDFEAKHDKIIIASVAPGPLLLLEKHVTNQSIILNHDLLPTNQEAQLVFSDQDIQTDELESLYIGSENLFVNCDAMVVSADKKAVSFQELAGMSFVVLKDIGIWQDIIEKHIPKAKFLYQEKADNFDEIRRFSSLPFFTTNLTQKLASPDTTLTRRHILTITDQEAKIDFYLTYRKAEKKDLQATIQLIQKTWQGLV